MPQTYHDFDPWRQAAQNIAQGMLAAQQARNRRALAEQEMQQRQPLIDAQTRNATASAIQTETETSALNRREEAIKRFGPLLAKSIKQRDDGIFEITPEGMEAFGQFSAEMSRDANDIANASRNLLGGANQSREKALDRTSREVMNDADNKALLARAELPSKNTPAERRIYLQTLANEMRDLRGKMDEMGPPTSKSKQVDVDQYFRWQREYNKRRKILMGEGETATPAESSVAPLTPDAGLSQGGNTPVAPVVRRYNPQTRRLE